MIEFLGEVGTWFADPATWSGRDGIPTRLLEHLWISGVAFVVVLLATGAAGSGALLWALGCVAMMAAMMFMMPGGHDHK